MQGTADSPLSWSDRPVSDAQFAALVRWSGDLILQLQLVLADRWKNTL
jgi:hypothetical protein